MRILAGLLAIGMPLAAVVASAADSPLTQPPGGPEGYKP